MFIRLNKRGQTTAEYAILIGLVIAAAIGIQALIKEGIHDRIVAEVKKLKDPAATAGTGTFSILATSTTTRSGTESMLTSKGGLTTKSVSSVDKEIIGRETYEEYSF